MAGEKLKEKFDSWDSKKGFSGHVSKKSERPKIQTSDDDDEAMRKEAEALGGEQERKREAEVSEHLDDKRNTDASGLARISEEEPQEYSQASGGSDKKT